MRKKRRGDVILMLLGSSSRLEYRTDVRRKLLRKGYKDVIIMEKIEEKNESLDYGGLDEKFEWILKKKKPDLFIAVFYKKTPNDGILFEIGWLCGSFGISKIKDKLRFIFEKGYDIKSEETTAYLSELFSKIPRNEFDDSDKYSTSAELIHKFVSI